MADFARSWDDLGPDLYMADGGRYRRRRHGSFGATADVIVRNPHRPHFQSRDYNPLNGDVQRWFEPITVQFETSPVLQAVLRLCRTVVSQATRAPANQRSQIEVHQFRIEATPDAVGKPTPEGLHRDGVDWVFVMLVDRRNVAEGVTEIGSMGGGELGRFTLSNPGDAIILDDRRILHGVTPIHAIDRDASAYRDALVVTFAADDA